MSTSANASEHKHTIVSHHSHAYSSHPAVARLTNGELVAAFTRTTRLDPETAERIGKPFLHPPNDPGFQNYLTRSTDGGSTWSWPRIVPDYGWQGMECPGLTLIRSGTLLVNQYQFRWYPLETGRKLLEQGVVLYARVEGKGWTRPESDSDWAKAVHPWVRSHGGSFIQRSIDGGHTWEETVTLDTSPYRGGYSNHGGTVAEDGKIHLALGARGGNHGSLMVLTSEDDGVTWDAAVVVAEEPEIKPSEPSICALPGGKLLLVARTGVGHKDAGQIYQSISEDQGRSWSPLVPTPMFGHPPHLLRLSDGRVLCSYGNRREPFEIKACLSEDGGSSWLMDREIKIRENLPSRNLGYPTTVELEPGRLFTIYYGEDSLGVTCIQGTTFQV